MGATRNLRRFLPALLALIAVTAGCRLDMHEQPYYRPLAKSDFFPDDRSARLPVEGTVAQCDPREDAKFCEDTYFHTGKIGNAPGDYLPFPVTAEVLARGRERFNINCTPCHGRVGDGNGFIPSRGFRHPPSYHIDRLRKVPIGYFFDVMTNGFGVMPEYGTQVAPRDRWCIAAYIRALQLSQNANSADIPAGQQVPSPAPQFRDIGNGATLPQVATPTTETNGEPK
ncbi:MAG: cytochrome c [Terriglobales bacterium]|jgi:mono/diheme cytochrome c family protein